MKIEILSLRLIEPKESGLIGFSDVRVNLVTIQDFRQRETANADR